MRRPIRIDGDRSGVDCLRLAAAFLDPAIAGGAISCPGTQRRLYGLCGGGADAAIPARAVGESDAVLLSMLLTLLLQNRSDMSYTAVWPLPTSYSMT